MQSNRSKAKGQIDSAMLHEVASLYRETNPSNAVDWTWQSSIEVTVALIETSDLRIAAPPLTGNAEDDNGPIAHLHSELGSEFQMHVPDEEIRKLVFEAVKVWAERNPLVLRTALHESKKHVRQLSRWREESRKFNWISFSHRGHGLFEEQLIPAFENTTKMSGHYIRELWDKSNDNEIVKKWVRLDATPGSDVEAVLDLYFYSALIRGRYHDELAKQAKLQITHHPFRARVLDPIDGTPQTSLTVPTGVMYLAHIIVADSFGAKTQLERIDRWAQSVKRARDFLAESERFFEPHQYDLKRGAAKAARQIGLGTSSAKLELLSEEALALMATLGTLAFKQHLQGWEYLTIDRATKALFKGSGIAKVGGNLIAKNETRLRNLADVPAGRIERSGTPIARSYEEGS